MFRHGELRLNAFWAAFTARSTSALSPSAISAILFSLTGFSVGKVFPLTASTNSLLIKSCVGKKINLVFIPLHSEIYFRVLNFLIRIGHLNYVFKAVTKFTFCLFAVWYFKIKLRA